MRYPSKVTIEKHKKLHERLTKDKFDSGRYPIDYTNKFRCPLCNEVKSESSGQLVKFGDGRNMMICKIHKKVK